MPPAKAALLYRDNKAVVCESAAHTEVVGHPLIPLGMSGGRFLVI
jgi:hypothetical protein